MGGHMDGLCHHLVVRLKILGRRIEIQKANTSPKTIFFRVVLCYVGFQITQWRGIFFLPPTYNGDVA